jgi:hypothetical protein
MLKRTHCCFLLLAGLVLLGLGMARLLHQDATIRRAAEAQRARVQAAVDSLNGCQTCHTDPVAPPAIAPSAQERPALRVLAVDSPGAPAPVPRPGDRQAQVDRALHATGVQVVALLDQDPQRYAPLVTEFLRAYDATRDITTPAQFDAALTTLDRLAVVLVAMHTASPSAGAWWRTASSVTLSPLVGATPGFSAPPLVAVMCGAVCLVVVGGVVSRCDARRVFVPAIAVILRRRRGPPVNAFNRFNTVGYGDCGLLGAVSFFVGGPASDHGPTASHI